MATIKDIAKHSGLGLATISKYLNGGTVLEVNRIAIEAAINETGFVLNEMARGLRSGNSRTIGVVIPELSNTFITTILTFAEDIFRSNGYSMIISDCRTDPEREFQAIDFMLSKQVDGIINMPVNQDGRHLLSAVEKDIPIVLIDRVIHELMDKVSTVLVDNAKAADEATQILIDAGHKDIGIILGPEDIFTSQQRLLGYKQALIRNGIIPHERFVHFSDYTTQGGHDGAMYLFENEKPTALFTTNYEMTLGVIIAINELKLSIPNDIALIGFDNMQLAKVVNPELTIVEQPLKKIAESCAMMMLEILSNKNLTPENKILTTKIHIGGSV